MRLNGYYLLIPVSGFSNYMPIKARKDTLTKSKGACTLQCMSLKLPERGFGKYPY